MRCTHPAMAAESPHDHARSVSVELNQAGAAGPSNANCSSAYNASLPWATNPKRYWLPNIANALGWQALLLPSGTYMVTAAGASGGYTGTDFASMCLGAVVRTTITVTSPNITLYVLVGQTGAVNVTTSGGGGTFVVVSNETVVNGSRSPAHAAVANRPLRCRQTCRWRCRSGRGPCRRVAARRSCRSTARAGGRSMVVSPNAQRRSSAGASIAVAAACCPALSHAPKALGHARTRGTRPFRRPPRTPPMRVRAWQRGGASQRRQQACSGISADKGTCASACCRIRTAQLRRRGVRVRWLVLA